MKDDAELGVPPLRWADGDHIGNIRRLIEVDLKALDNEIDGKQGARFEPATGLFQTGSSGEVSWVSQAQAVADHLDARAGTGGRTLTRAAIWRSFLREEGRGSQGERGRDGLLADLARLADDRPSTVTALFIRKPTHTPEQAEALARAIGTTGQSEADAFRSGYKEREMNTLDRVDHVIEGLGALPDTDQFLAQRYRVQGKISAIDKVAGASIDRRQRRGPTVTFTVTAAT